MSKDTIVLDKDKANELYNKVVESLPNKKDFDELVDSRLIVWKLLLSPQNIIIKLIRIDFGKNSRL